MTTPLETVQDEAALRQLAAKFVRLAKTKQTAADRLGDATDIQNSPRVRTELSADTACMFIFSQSNNAALNHFLGKHDGVIRREYNVSYWRIKYADTTFTIFSGPGKGSSYAVDASFREVFDGKYDAIISQFLSDLLELIKPFAQEKIQQLRSYERAHANKKRSARL